MLSQGHLYTERGGCIPLDQCCQECKPLSQLKRLTLIFEFQSKSHFRRFGWCSIDHVLCPKSRTDGFDLVRKNIFLQLCHFWPQKSCHHGSINITSTELLVYVVSGMVLNCGIKLRLCETYKILTILPPMLPFQSVRVVQHWFGSRTPVLRIVYPVAVEMFISLISRTRITVGPKDNSYSL